MSALIIPFLPIPFPVIDSVEDKSLKEWKTAEFWGNGFFLNPEIVVYVLKNPSKAGNVDDSSEVTS